MCVWALTNDVRADQSPCLEGLLIACSSPSAHRTTAKLRGHVCIFHTNKPSVFLALFYPFSFLASKFVLFSVLCDYNILSFLEQNELKLPETECLPLERHELK